MHHQAGFSTPYKHVCCVQVRLAPSQSKNKLYIGNVPKTWSKERWDEELNRHVRGAAPQLVINLKLSITASQMHALLSALDARSPS